MKRQLYEDLVRWRNSANRKPLILQGARHVGKTWLMKEFGKNEFEQVVYLNFESSERLKSLFAPDFDIKRIISIKVFSDKYQPKIALRFSINQYREQDWLTNLPLYAVNGI